MVADAETIQRVIATYGQAAEANRNTPARNGSVVHLTESAGEDVLITADLHGHRLNFERLRKIADLPSRLGRHWIAQEVCHGGPTYPDGGCMSHLMLEDVALLKTQFPERFHFLLGNHELAELTDHLITKSGQMLNLHFLTGLQAMYGDMAEAVRDAAMAFIRTCPLALRLEPSVFVCHGSPERVDEVGWDPSVLAREPTAEDIAVGGAAFRLVWGRDFRQENAEALAECVGAEVLIHGHEPCVQGCSIPNSRQVILDCCGKNACYVILPIGRHLTHAEVVEQIRHVYSGQCTSSSDDGTPVTVN